MLKHIHIAVWSYKQQAVVVCLTLLLLLSVLKRNCFLLTLNIYFNSIKSIKFIMVNLLLFVVGLERGSYPVPFRTWKSSLSSPIILPGPLVGMQVAATLGFYFFFIYYLSFIIFFFIIILFFYFLLLCQFYLFCQIV